MSSQMSASDQTAIPAVLVGTAAWLVALVVVGLSIGATVPEEGVWWWGVCLVGSASGLIGLVFLRWRRARLMKSGRLA